MSQAVETFIAVMGPVYAVVLVGKTAITVGSVVLCVDMAHLRKDVFVLLYSDALFAVQPFVIAGAIQAEDFAEELNGVIPFQSLLHCAVETQLSRSIVLSYQLPSWSLTFFNRRLASFSSSISAFRSLFSA